MCMCIFVLQSSWTLQKNFVNCPYTKLSAKKSVQYIIDEKSKQEKNARNT